MQENISNSIVYNDGELELKVSVEQESVWLTQKQIAELFEVNPKYQYAHQSYLQRRTF